MGRPLLAIALLLSACDNQLASNQAALGEACDPGPECAPGLACFMDVPGGECSKPCATDGDCGIGAVCVSGVCKPACAVAADCSRQGFTCAGTYCAPSPTDGGADQSPLPAIDLAGSPLDLAMTQMPDLAAPDLSLPDLAMPDLAMPDLATPDLAMPDLAMPDLAMPDLSTPDLTILADLSTLPDLVAAPDLVSTADFAEQADLVMTGVTCIGAFTNQPQMMEENIHVAIGFGTRAPGYTLDVDSVLLGNYMATQKPYIVGSPPMFHEDYVGDGTTTGVTMGDNQGNFCFTDVPTVTLNVQGGRAAAWVTCWGTGPLHGCGSIAKGCFACY